MNAVQGALARTARNASSALAQGILVKTLRFALAFLSHVLIRRTLGPEVFGNYLLAQLWLDLAAAVASLGMGQVVLRFLPEARLGRDRGAARRLLLWALGFQLVGWVAVVVAASLGRPWLDGWLGGHRLPGLFLLVAYLLGARLLFDLVTQVYHAVLDVRPVTVATIGWQVVFLAGLFVSFARDGGAAGVVIAAAVANALTAVWLILGWRSRVGVTHERSVEPLTLRRVLSYGLPFAAVGLLYNVVWRASEGFFINYFHGERAAGFFGAAYSLPQLVLEFIPTAIWPIVMASYATVFALDRERAARLVEHYYKLLFLVVAPLSVGGALFGDRLYLALYGAAFEPGATLCRVFFVVQCVSFVGTPLSMSLYILEKSRLNLLVWIGAAIVNVALDLVLIPGDWRIGGTVPVALAVLLMPPAFWLLLRREGFRVHVPWRFIGRAYLAAASLLLLLPLRGLRPGILEVAGIAIAGAALFVLAMRVVRLFREDDEALLALIPWGAARRAARWVKGGAA